MEKGCLQLSTSQYNHPLFFCKEEKRAPYRYALIIEYLMQIQSLTPTLFHVLTISLIILGGSVHL